MFMNNFSIFKVKTTPREKYLRGVLFLFRDNNMNKLREEFDLQMTSCNSCDQW